MFTRVDYQKVADNQAKEVEQDAIQRCILVDECKNMVVLLVSEAMCSREVLYIGYRGSLMQVNVRMDKDKPLNPETGKSHNSATKKRTSADL